ncbi:MAG TPA: hypothetical protein VFQ61_30185 [Polyangiaceae bacterium]|nr:hypothetical protein [Polyangiaceae bacterium]
MTELDPDVSAQLRSAYQARAPSSDRKAKMLRTLQASLIAGGLTAGGAAQATQSSLKLWLSKHALTFSLLGLGAGSAALGGVWISRAVSPPAATAVVSSAAPHEDRSPAGSPPSRDEASTLDAPVLASSGNPTSPREQTPVAPAPQTRDSISRTLPDALPRNATSSRNTPAPRSEVVPKDDLAAEVALLQKANAAYRSGRAADALTLVSEHVKRFPRSQLSAERSTLKVLALCASHRVEEARRAASGISGSAALRGSCIDR